MQGERRSQKKLKKTLSQQQQANQKALKVNNLFNKLIAYNYNSKFSDNAEIQDDISKFFEMLLWCEKKCPQIVCQLFEMMAIQQIQELHLKKCISSFFKNYILVLGNCMQQGIIAEMFLENKLPHILLEAYLSNENKEIEKDEKVEYVGSYLKAYHRIFRPQWLKMFIISQDYFQLLQVSFKFFNCPEPLTQTTVFNIVLDILGHKQVQHFIMNSNTRYAFYQNMVEQMSKLIRNQLVEFGLRIQHISLKDSVNQVMGQIQDKITLWEDLSRTCQKMSALFQLSFSKNVLLPLLIGPLHFQNSPLFTLKYSLFIIKKLLKTIKNFGILEVFIRMIFIEDNVYYWPNSLSKAMIKPFNIEQLLSGKIDVEQTQQKQNYGNGIRKFYQGVFRSKDNHFILMSTSLLNQLHQNLKGQEELCHKFGLEPKGKLNNQICQKLIRQLSQTHRLITVQAIINTLVIINNKKVLTSQLQTMFIYIFKNTIEQTKIALKSKSELWDFIVEINQYDIVRVSTIKFGQIEDNKKFQEMFKVVFMWDIKQEEATSLSFYSSIPDTVQDQFRYFFVKFLLLRKARSLLIEGLQQTNMVNDYYSKFIVNSPFNPGDVHKLFQLKCQMYECQIVEGKVTIPALWIVDQNYFVLGHFNKQKKQVRIIMGIKYKHISAQMVARKQSVMITLAVQYYQYQSERLKYKNSITIRGIQNLLHKIISYQIKMRQKQMVFISNSIKKTEETLPAPSLI